MREFLIAGLSAVLCGLFLPSGFLFFQEIFFSRPPAEPHGMGV
jgi:hypothetical protein